MKLDNNIYDNNTVFDTNEKEIFNGNFKELKNFMLNTFNFKLTDNEDMEAYEDFNGHEFKIQMGIHIDQEFLNQLEATARAEAKLEEIYNKVFGKFSIKEMLEMIKSKEILNYMNQYMNEIPLSFDNPYEANYFIFETVDDFNIERTAQSLSIIQNDQFPSRKYVEQFDYGVLKDIISFKVDKFEKVLQLLNFPKEIEVVLGRVQYVLNEDTKEYELQFLNLKDELQVKGDLFENNNIKKQWSNKIYSKGN